MSVQPKPDTRQDPTTTAYVSRQPIYRKQLTVYGYELLFRNSQLDHADVTDGDGATAQVILNFIEMGLNEIVGKHRAFINVTRRTIVDGHCASLPKERVVLEVLEDVSADSEVLKALQKLKAAGYIIALDDFVYRPDLIPLLELADIVKVDVMATDRGDLEALLPRLLDFNVSLLAEKVETQDDFEFCRDLGFDFFQGFFFCKPKLIEGKQIPPNRIAAARLMAKLKVPGLKIAELEEIIRQDVSLSYKLLRFVNSAYCSLSHRVDSISHAATLIGIERISTWASMLMLATMDDRPRELIVTGTIRARMCEELARANGILMSDRFFTVGLFSVLDAMLDVSMVELLKKLPLSDDIVRALLRHEDLLGQILAFTIAYEQADWERLEKFRKLLNLAPNDIRNAYLNALNWTNDFTSKLEI